MTPAQALLPEPAVGKYTGTNKQVSNPLTITALDDTDIVLAYASAQSTRAAGAILRCNMTLPRSYGQTRPRCTAHAHADPCRENATVRTRAIDRRRIYACGLSAGAGMAAVLALNHPELIAAPRTPRRARLNRCRRCPPC